MFKRTVSGIMLILFLVGMLLLALNIPNSAVMGQPEQWVPYVPYASYVEFYYWKENGTSYMNVSIEFASSGFNVSDWGTPDPVGNNISVNAKIWRWTGVDFPVVITMSYTYNLGNLLAGEYIFTFKAWGFLIKSMAFTVSLIVPDDYPTIQEAINNADDGDLIFVRPGVYCENVVANKTVSLLGENRNTTIIDGGGNGTVVIIESATEISLDNFTIRNSGIIIDNRTLFPACGVLIQNADNARILNNLVIDNYLGVYLGCSQNDFLRNNDIKGNVYNFGVDNYGFHHDIDSSNTVNGKPIFYLVNQADVMIPSNAGYVAVIDCQDVVVKDLTLTNNWNGILFVHTDASTVENLTVADNYYGAYLSGSSYNVLRDNNLTHNRYNFGVRGDSLSHYVQCVDTSNVINRKPMYYLINQTKLRIDPTTIPKMGIGYLALVNSTEITAENLTLTDNIQGLLFAYITDSTIRNVRCKENCEGIMFYQSKHNTIAESDIANNSGVGIELYSDSSENVLTFNNVENHIRGICIIQSSRNNISENSIINNSMDGILMDLPGHNNVVGNIVSRNGWGMIGGAGIYLFRTSCWNTIVGNDIRDNLVGIGGKSVSLPSIVGTSIVENSIINNTYGIAILPGWESDTEIFHNNFVNNTCQVHSRAFYNFTWDNGYPSGGNYWSNYTGVDFYRGPYQNIPGSDGIGDTPHAICGNNQDHYPLMKPYAGPHDIGITNVTTSETYVGQGYNLSINAKMINYGINTETFDLTLYANTSIIQSLTNIVLTSRNSTIINFTWNTTGFAKGNYTIWAYAEPVMGETDTADNTLADGWVAVAVPGDFTGQGYPPCKPPDGKVDVNDQMCFVDAFFAKYGIPPPCPECVSWCDLTGPDYPPLKAPDGKVDVNDQMCFVDCFFAQYGIPPP